MKLILKRTQSKTMLGGKKYQLVAKVEMTKQESDIFNDFGLIRTTLYTSDEKGDSFRQYGSMGGAKIDLFAKLLASKKIAKIDALSLIAGMTFEDEFVLSIIEIQGRVVEAANVLDAAIKSAGEFLGEQSLDLPVV